MQHTIFRTKLPQEVTFRVEAHDDQKASYGHANTHQDRRICGCNWRIYEILGNAWRRRHGGHQGRCVAPEQLCTWEVWIHHDTEVSTIVLTKGKVERCDDLFIGEIEDMTARTRDYCTCITIVLLHTQYMFGGSTSLEIC